MTEDYFWSLKKEIEQECHSLSLSLAQIREEDLTEQLYIRFSHQVDNIQRLFDRVSEVNKDLDLDQNNPNLYKLLEAKQQLNYAYGQFNRERSNFFKRFAKFRSNREEDYERTRSLPESREEEPEEDLDVLPEDEPEWEEEDFDPDEEKDQKNKDRKARQKRLAEEGKKRDKQNAQQRQRQEEATRLGMFTHPDKAISETDLYQERVRQEEARIEAQRAEAARIQSENEAMRRHREKMDAAEQFEHLESSHIDMSREGIGHHSSEQQTENAYSEPSVTAIPQSEYTQQREPATASSKEPQYHPTTQETPGQEHPHTPGREHHYETGSEEKPHSAYVSASDSYKPPEQASHVVTPEYQSGTQSPDRESYQQSSYQSGPTYEPEKPQSQEPVPPHTPKQEYEASQGTASEYQEPKIARPYENRPESPDPSVSYQDRQPHTRQEPGYQPQTQSYTEPHKPETPVDSTYKTPSQPSPEGQRQSFGGSEPYTNQRSKEPSRAPDFVPYQFTPSGTKQDSSVAPAPSGAGDKGLEDTKSYIPASQRQGSHDKGPIPFTHQSPKESVKQTEFIPYLFTPSGIKQDSSVTPAATVRGDKEPADAKLQGQGSTDKGFIVFPHRSHNEPVKQGEFVPYQFTPGGVSRDTSVVSAASIGSAKLSQVSDSNAKIYSSLMANRNQESKEPILVSPAIETQMRFNVEQARIACMDLRGTPEAQRAVHAYIQQRNALAQYRTSVKEGSIRVDTPVSPTVPKTAAVDGKSPSPSVGKTPGTVGTAAAAGAGIVYSFTPNGTVGHTFNNGQLTGNQYQFYNPGLKGKPFHSPSNPMVVSPKYEEAIAAKMKTASESLNTAIQTGDPKLRSVDPKQMKMYTDAFLSFQQAKREGTVVVSSKAGAPDVPDYHAWQQRRIAQTTANGNVFTPKTTITGQTKGPNPNQVSKKSVEEAVANIFNRSSHLKQQSVASMYARQVGSRFQYYSYGALIRFSQQIYRVTQSGDDNALRTFEQGRYYVTTAAGIVLAVKSGVPTKALEKQVEKASAQQFGLFGTKTFMTNAELSASVNNGLRVTRELDKKITELQGKLVPFEEKINKYAAANPYADKLGGLDKFSRREYEKLSSQLKELKSEHASAMKNLKLDQKLQTMRHQEHLEKELLKKLDSNGKYPTNPKALQEAGRKIQEQANLDMKKKHGAFFKVTDKSLEKEITLLKQQGKELKAQIKLLEAKGSALSAPERQLLVKLKKQSKELGGQISKLSGVLKDRADFAFVNKKLDEMIKNAYRNKGRITNGLYALQGFMIRPLQVGADSNTDGLARMIQISTNRYVHILVKKSVKTSVFLTKTGMNMVVPGSSQAMDTAIYIAKTGIQAKVGIATNTVKTAVSTGVKATGHTIASAVPTGIKTRVISAGDKIHALKSKYDTVATGIKNAVYRSKVWFADTKVGRGFAAVRRFNSNATEAVKSVFGLIKGVGLKALAWLAAIYLIVGVISVGVGMLGAAAGSSIIASPDEADEKVDLSKYMDIIGTEQARFDREIYALKTDSTYDNVYINYTGPISNNKEMLCMMAVRMNQELDLGKNKKVEKYLKSLYQDSHTYTTEERHYQCSGCEEREEHVWEFDEEMGIYVWATEIDPDTGLEYYVYETVKYCPGHVDLSINISILVFDEIFYADTYSSEGQTANAGEKIGDFKITYYCACEICCGPNAQGITASGTTATANRTIAVDPSVIPLGTHVIIDGQEYVAEDTGGAIQGNRIDIFMSSHSAALSAGVKNNVSVYYPSYEGGSYEETGKWDGWTEQNIEWAKLIYSMPWDELYTGYYEFSAISSGGTSEPVEPEFIPVDGEFTWPIPGYTNITSPFGYRNQPTAGASTNHKGIDIGASVGASIYAAAAGTVIGSGEAGAAGIMVTIDHGGGILTKYMHNSRNAVSVGTVVEAGQLIAYAGSTGVSTGPHLHFQIEINGTPVNPLNYVTPH